MYATFHSRQGIRTVPILFQHHPAFHDTQPSPESGTLPPDIAQSDILSEKMPRVFLCRWQHGLPAASSPHLLLSDFAVPHFRPARLSDRKQLPHAGYSCNLWGENILFAIFIIKIYKKNIRFQKSW